jgi:hypothetical protein
MPRILVIGFHFPFRHVFVVTHGSKISSEDQLKDVIRRDEDVAGPGEGNESPEKQNQSDNEQSIGYRLNSWHTAAEREDPYRGDGKRNHNEFDDAFEAITHLSSCL